jgi:hypothetical protein
MRKALLHLFVAGLAIGAGFINMGLGIIVMVIGYSALVGDK